MLRVLRRGWRRRRSSQVLRPRQPSRARPRPTCSPERRAPTSIDGRAGNDTLAGLGGADFLLGGAGQDTSTPAPGDDRIPAHADGARDTHPLRRRSRHRHGGADRRRRRVTARSSAGRSRATATTRPDRPARDARSSPTRSRSARPSSRSSRSAASSEGGAVAIGFSTSRDAGATWKIGLAPGRHGLVAAARLGGAGERPGHRVRRSPRHLAGCHARHLPGTSSFYLYVNRSVRRALVERAGGRGHAARAATSTRSGSRATTRRRARSAATATSRTSTSPSGEIRTTTTTDGGLTWSHAGRELTRAAAAGSTSTARSRSSSRTARSSSSTRRSPIPVSAPAARSQATRSTDGGAIVLGTRPCRIRSPRRRSRQCGRSRLPPLRSTPPDACTSRGRDVPERGSCSASRIVLATSIDGVTWTPAQSRDSRRSGRRPLPARARRQPGGVGPARARLPLDPRRLRQRPGVPRASTSSRRRRRTADGRGRSSSGSPRSRSLSIGSPARAAD